MSVANILDKMDPPCGCLPLEIWQKIFQLALSSEHIPILAEADPHVWSPPESSSDSLILPSTPSTLSSVSQSWRRCAHGMPDMWNVLYVKVPKSMKHGDEMETPPEILELVKARLSLSQCMPLKICVVAKKSIEFGRSFIRALTPFSRQWEKIHFYAPSETYSEFKCLRATDFPNLLSFNIVPQVYSNGPGAHDSVHVDELPFFNEVSSIRRFHTSLIPSSTSPIYPRLHDFHISATRSETWLITPILGLCSQLKVLTLSGYGITAQEPSSVREVILPNLETLILEHPPGRERLLNSLILPNLKSLLLGGRCTGPSTASILNAIRLLKERSRVDSFKRFWLYFEVYTMHPATLIDFLRDNDSIRELRIDDTGCNFMCDEDVMAHFFAALARRNKEAPDNRHGNSLPQTTQQPDLCPKLETLHLISNGCSGLESTELANFIEERCMGRIEPGKEDFSSSSPLTPIVHLDISIKRAASTALPEVTREWKEKGCSVDVNIVD